MSKIKNIAVICARSGSRRVKNKNIYKIGDKPLWFHSALFARKLNIIDEIIINSDSDEIVEQANKNGFTGYKRPTDLGINEVFVVDVIKEMLITKKVDHNCTLLTLFPTVLFRSVNQLLKAFQLFDSKGGNNSIVSVRKFDYPPEVGFYMNESGKLSSAFPEKYSKSTKHDAFRPVYRLTYNFLIHSVKMLLNQNNLIGNSPIGIECSFLESIDIDEKYQLRLVEKAYNDGWTIQDFS